MALESWEYSDPMFVAIRREEEANRKLRECGGCKHHVSATFEGETLHRCDIKRHGFGKRCDQFTTKGKP